MNADYETALAALAQRFGVETIYVFGSRAAEIAARIRGAPSAPGPAGSDVDVAVQPAGRAGIDPADRVALMQALETLFDVDRVDLVILPEANAFLAAEVVRGEILYCADALAQAEEELYYLRRAGDLAPLLHQKWDEMTRKVQP